MRPLYAIAPLALLIALFGPTPHEANEVLADFIAQFKDRRQPPQQDDNRHDVAGNKPQRAAGNLVNTVFTR